MLELLDGCSTIGESTRVNITDIIVNVTIFKMVEIMSMLLVSWRFAGEGKGLFNPLYI